MEQLKMEIGAVSDKGNIKPSNQDNILVQIGEHNGEEFGLFVVCDGLGGLAFGEVASVIAVRNMKKWWETQVATFVKETNDKRIIESLKEMIYLANEEIIKYSTDINQKVGTTISSLLILKGKYYIVHVGDSRVYKISTNIEQLTEDHSYVAMQVRNGEITKEEARKSQKKNLLLQCLGVKQSIQIYSKVGRVRNDESFVVCSDGFYNSLNDWEILQFLKRWKYTMDKSLQELTLALVEEVKNRKERDNISSIIISVNKPEQSLLKKFFR